MAGQIEIEQVEMEFKGLIKSDDINKYTVATKIVSEFITFGRAKFIALGGEKVFAFGGKFR